MDPEEFNGANNEGEERERERAEEHLVLLDGTKLERIPWESVGILRERVISVTRARSLACLEHNLRSPTQSIYQRDMFYLINPTGNLQRQRIY